ncbi:hypothetical protein [Nitrosospira sp. Nsp14]|uniref:hypothetical protein n=1 Tax=Nitrosospira sp. Nsp14 TaxID=1855333 RepID=UPI00116029D2|nr:hypothetical protein [Nitrosospira sp. Nsp14]
MRFNIYIFYGVFVLLFSQGSHGETITSEKNEKISVRCECLLSLPLCELEVFASAAGKPLQTWYQDVTLTAGKITDLNAACYKNRDVDGMGDGLCCVTSDAAKTITNLFRGTRY